jgi:formylglycine-generating enzyme required for sulfatase activity/tRNA A-37 threonylcarbamoyl transferase component Bud32
LSSVSTNDALASRLGAALGDGYAVERLLGAGGMASVYLVRDVSLKRYLAVKVLSPDLITSHSVLERFRREAETVAQLSHPNIVPLHFIGEQDELLYLAMQCVDGGSIADRLEREKTLPLDEAVRITREVASALAHAHKRGVVHRDIKPANVLVDAESGRCLVTDFGIARTADSGSLTATGMMVGTPAYLSPEQVTGESNDHRVDIFALGVMAYEMIAGQLPFDGPTPTAAVLRRLAGPPEPLGTIRADVPDNVASVIERCLVADPSERWQTANDVVDALNGITTTGSSLAATTKMPHSTAHRVVVAPAGSRRTRVIVGIAAVAAVVVVGTAGALYFANRPPANGGGVGSPSSAASSAAAMVTIAAGAYPIGTDSGPAFARPRHTEQVAAFRIERTEVTVGAYRAFVSATKASAPWGTIEPDSTLPVTRVSWGDAANFCAWRYPPDGRLPTEFEWEAAARGRDGRPFPWGTAAGTANANTRSAQRSGPVPVGSFPRGATTDGLQDLSGNVWEWTSSPLVAYTGAKALPDSLSEYRVIRGGAFDTNDEIATGWMRGYLKSTTAPSQLPNTGFRCVRSADGTSKD